MDDDRILTLPDEAVTTLRKAYADVGCTVASMRHIVAPSAMPGSSDHHTIEVDQIGWSRSLHSVVRTGRGFLSLIHLLEDDVRQQAAGTSEPLGDILDLDQDELRDLIVKTMAVDLKEQRRRRDIAARLGIDAPIQAIASIGPIVVDRMLSSHIAGRPHDLEKLPSWILMASDADRPLDCRGVEHLGSGTSVYRLSVNCDDAPRLHLHVALERDDDGIGTITYDGFEMRVHPGGRWPQTVTVSLPGRRVGDVIETGLKPLDARIISAVDTGHAGELVLTLEPDAVRVADLIDSSDGGRAEGEAFDAIV